jgi:hypothetical protein
MKDYAWRAGLAPTLTLRKNPPAGRDRAEGSERMTLPQILIAAGIGIVLFGMIGLIVRHIRNGPR